MSNEAVDTIKHLIQCRCILPQFKKKESQVFHKFVVFSVMKNDEVEKKLVQCNNCGIIHKITDLCHSEVITGKESAGSILTALDIKNMVPSRLAGLLEPYSLELHTWEELHYYIENSIWGKPILLTLEVIDGEYHGKHLIVKGKDEFYIKPFSEPAFLNQ